MPQPNILFIMTDQEAPSLIGCYGNPVVQTPARDAIAEGGIRFNNCYCASFPCSPSRASMITGLYAHHHGIVTNDIMLDPDIPTLGSCLQDAGYRTAWIGKSHLGGNMYRGIAGEPMEGHWRYAWNESPNGYGWDRVPGGVGEDGALNGFGHWRAGWEDYRAYLRGTDLPRKIVEDPWVGNHHDAPSTGDRGHAISRLGKEHHMAHYFADETIRFLEEAAEDEAPFGCVLSFYGPHLPVAPPEPWDTMYDLADIPLPPTLEVGLEGKPLRQRSATRQRVNRFWSEDELRDYVRRYYGYVSYIDAQMQRVLDALDRLDLADDTIVLFTTDHGDMLGHFGMVYKLTGNAYDTLMQVPLMIRWPKGIPAGQADDGLVSNVDLLPTLLELAGIPTPEVDGQSLAAAVRGEPQRRREAVTTDIMGTGFMLRRGPWKYALHASACDTDAPRDLDELYKLDDDPYETRNLAHDPAQAERVTAMREEILAWLREAEHPYADLVAKRAAIKPPTAQGLYPELLAFQDMGEGRFWLRYRWVRTGDLPHLSEAEDYATLTRRGAYGRITTLWQDTGEPLPDAESWALGPAEQRVMEGWVEPDVTPGMAELNLGLRIAGRTVRLATGYEDVMPWAHLQIRREHGVLRLDATLIDHRLDAREAP